MEMRVRAYLCEQVDEQKNDRGPTAVCPGWMVYSMQYTSLLKYYYFLYVRFRFTLGNSPSITWKLQICPAVLSSLSCVLFLGGISPWRP